MPTKKIRLSLKLALILAVLCSVFILQSPRNTYADPIVCPDGQTVDVPGVKSQAEACVGHMTPVGTPSGKPSEPTNDFIVTPVNDCDHCITKDVQLLINFVAIGVGVVVVAMIIIGGIQYTTSRDNPQAVQAAKAKVFNAIIALIAFTFTYTFLQWIVPGGIF